MVESGCDFRSRVGGLKLYILQDSCAILKDSVILDCLRLY